MNEKKTCFSCAYKENIPGNCHISCRFDWNKSTLKPPEVNKHGIKAGWYLFPVNFDPVWQLEPCKAHSTSFDKNMYLEKFHPLLELFSILR